MPSLSDEEIDRIRRALERLGITVFLLAEPLQPFPKHFSHIERARTGADEDPA